MFTSKNINKKDIVKAIEFLQEVSGNKEFQQNRNRHSGIIAKAWASDENWKNLCEIIASEIDDKIRQESFLVKSFKITDFPCQREKEITTRITEKVNDDPVLVETAFDDLSGEFLAWVDRCWYSLVTESANKQIFSKFTPSAFTQLVTEIEQWGIPKNDLICFIHFNLWNDIIGNNAFSSLFSPISKHEKLLEGHLGELCGIPVMTDGFRPEEYKVLGTGDVLICSKSHAGLFNLDTIKTKMTVHKEEVARDWIMTLKDVMQVANTKAVCWGKCS